jgi:hypothetical protein
MNTPKPKPTGAAKPQIGTDVYFVSCERFCSRVAVSKELRKNSKARVVGESFFNGRFSHHERLLQLQCESTGTTWYVPEQQVQIPHFIFPKSGTT